MSRRAFTLFEVIVAVALLGGLLGAMFTFHENLLDTRRRALEFADRESAASLMIDRLEDALFTSLVGDTKTGAGIKGDDHSISVVYRSVAASEAERGLRAPQVLGDLQRLDIQFSESSHEVSGLIEPVMLTGNVARTSPSVIGLVHRVRLRYHDGNGWVTSYDSRSAGKLPLAVEVALWYAPWPGEALPEEEENPALADGARETFDASAYAFDETTVEDLEASLTALPRPDRVRIITIPDSDAADDRADTSGAPEEIVP